MATLPFYIFLFIHLISLVVGFGAVIVIDTFGLLWIRKKVSLELVTTVANTTQKLIWLGWSGLVISGIGLIVMKGFVDNLTIIKLFFVAMLGINGIFLHHIKNNLENRNFRIGLASAVSQLGWWGAIVIGFLHRHWRYEIDWPPNPWLVIGIIVILITLAAIIGERRAS